MESRVTTEFTAQAEIVAVFQIDDSADPFWWDEAFVRNGVVTSERFTTRGPFFTSEPDLLARAARPRSSSAGTPSRTPID